MTDETRWVVVSLESDSEGVRIIGQRAEVQRFRPWWERWFTRPWRPFVKWETEQSGRIREIGSDLTITLDLTD